MTLADPEDDAKTDACLIDALSEENWHARQLAVDRLIDSKSEDVVAELIDILRKSNRDLSRLNGAISVLANVEIDVVPELLDLFAHGDPELRTYVALTLGERGDVRAIPELIRALDDADTNVRLHSIEALGKLKAGAAVDHLIAFVQSQEFPLAFAALDALGSIGDERVYYALTPLLTDPLLGSATIEALGALGGEEVIAQLFGLLGTPGSSTGTIVAAIKRIHDRHQTRYGSGESIQRVIRHRQIPATIATLQMAIQTSIPSEVTAAIAMLVWLHVPEADQFILDSLDIPEHRAICRDALAARGSTIIPALLERFERTSAECRLCLIDLCVCIADRRAVPKLLASLDSRDEQAVFASLAALSRIGDARSYPAVIKLLGHPNTRIRHSAVAAVNSLAHPDTANDIERLLKDSSAWVRESALKVAAYLGFNQSADALIALCHDPDLHVRRAAVEHLPCIEHARIIDELANALESEWATVRAAAARALGEMGRKGEALLSRATADADAWVRYFAVRSLAQIGCHGEARRGFVHLATSDAAMQVRIAAVETLGMEAILELSTLAKSEDDDMAAAALSRLGATGAADVLPTLADSAFSNRTRVQIAAINALGNTKLGAAAAALHELALSRMKPTSDAAISALGCILSDESVHALLSVLRVPTKRKRALEALRNLGEGAVPMVARYLHECDLDVRRVASEFLVGLPSREAAALLESLLEDSEPAVRYCALTALAYGIKEHQTNPTLNYNMGDA